TGFSDKLRDAPIAKPLLHNRSFVFIPPRSLGAYPCAAAYCNVFAIVNSGCVFVTDTLGTETIAACRFGQRSCLSSGCASGQQYRASFEWIGTGGKSGRIRRGRIEGAWLRGPARESHGAALGAWRRDGSPRAISRSGTPYHAENCPVRARGQCGDVRRGNRSRGD